MAAELRGVPAGIDGGRMRLPLPGLPEGWAALVALALWPVWGYLARAYTAVGADLSPGLVLLGAVGWALCLGRQARERVGSGLGWTLVFLGGYALGYLWLPPLARAMVGLAALGSALADLAGLGVRGRWGLVALLVLAAPSGDTLGFFVGAPLRAASALVAAAWLGMAGVPVRVEGAMLRIGEALFSVDAPCSGVNGLWSGLVIAAVLGVYRRLGARETALLGTVAVLLCVPANGLRSASLVYLSRLTLPVGRDAAHAGVGVVTFAAVTAALIWFSLLLGRRQGKERELEVRRLRAGWALPVLVTASALVPLVPTPTRAAAAAVAFPGWPAQWLGHPLRRLPETALDQRWARLSPAPLARFQLSDGSELLLRWTDRPGRWLHPPEDCYRGTGFTVSSMSPVRAPAPHQTEPVVWRRFLATRGAEAYEVWSVILSETGPTYPDPAWWWWKLAGPGATDSGPWWIATVQRRVSG